MMRKAKSAILHLVIITSLIFGCLATASLIVGCSKSYEYKTESQRLENMAKEKGYKDYKDYISHIGEEDE